MSKSGPGTIPDALRIIHIAGGGICVLILGGAAALGVIPAIRAHDADRARRGMLTEVTAELEGVGDQHVELLSKVEAMRESVRARDLQLTPAADVNRLLSELTVRIESLGLALLTLQPGTMLPGDPTASVPIQLWVEGSLGQVVAMLESLGAAHPDLHFRELTLEHTGPGTVRLRSSVRWLVAPPAKS